MAHPAGTKLFLRRRWRSSVGQRYETLWEQSRAAGYVRIRVDGQTYSVDQPPEIDRRRKHRVEVVVDRVTVRPEARSRIAGSVENALALGRGVLGVVYPQEGVPEPLWTAETHSQHFACHRCGRSFEPLGPHHFSFNSPLGWCPGCEGLGVQTGTNPAALLRDPKLTLAEGAVAALARGRQPPLPRHARRLRPRHRGAPGRPLRATHRQAPPPGYARHRRAMVRGESPLSLRERGRG